MTSQSFTSCNCSSESEATSSIDCQSPENRRSSCFISMVIVISTIARTLLFCTLLIFPWMVHATGSCKSSHSLDLDKVLGFQMPPAGDMPGGWKGGPPGTIFLDNQVVHAAQWAVRIERKSGSPYHFSSFADCIQMDFSGSSIELRGFLRTENVQGFTGLWLREDADGAPVAFDNMAGRNLHGTTGWTQYSINLPYKPEAQKLVFGALLAGTGKVWISNLQLLVDGKPVWTAPQRQLVQTVLDTDHQFDNGSGIVIKNLNRIQIENLVTLGKVWGFLKYYDPEVTSGHQQWDFDLFRILPAILAAPDRAKANAALVQWIKGLGPVAHCNPCVHVDKSNLQLKPDLSWIDDEQRLGKALSKSLRWIRDNGPSGKQFYVALDPVAPNPIFVHELPYAAIKFPDDGFQLLALYRFWNIIEYWYPYRNVVGENWDQVLADFIPRLALAKDHDSYERQLMALIAMIHDSHANLWGSLDAQPPVGSCHLPVRLRFIQHQPVVTGYLDGNLGMTSGLKIGDVVTQLDNVPVAQLVKEWAPYYGASNEAARLRNIATFMSRGNCGGTEVSIRRNSRDMNIQVKRVPLGAEYLNYGSDDLAGPTFRLLSPQVGYLKLSSIKAKDVANYIKQAAGTKGLIIDIRGYPSDFVGYALGSLLVDRQTPFVQFTLCNLSNPGAFYWTPPMSISPEKPHYTGKIVILVNDITQSEAEFTAMALRAAPGAMVVGSTTAGADGNVSKFLLPGELSTMISGIGVFYPDKQPTQRIGIVPNVMVRPTIAAIRDGRDPVLEEALHLILGSDVPAKKIQEMYMRLSSR